MALLLNFYCLDLCSARKSSWLPGAVWSVDVHMIPGGRGPMGNVTEPKADNNGDNRGPVWTFSGRQHCDGEQLTGEQIV